jgi:phenylalanyl-tRNA synthetase beta chain
LDIAFATEYPSFLSELCFPELKPRNYTRYLRNRQLRSLAFDTLFLATRLAVLMKISLKWLADHLGGPLEPHLLGDALTHGGLPVEVFEKRGDDDVIDVEVTSNRGDCLSHIGVARELGALLNRPTQELPASAFAAPSASVSTATVRVDEPDLCPFYSALVIRNVKVGPSPQWMVNRLESIGLRSINNVVDITNYVMFEMGQPLHAFDYDQLSGGTIIVRRAIAGEKLASLDGKLHTLTPDMLVIADAQKPAALAGIMGGQQSEVAAKTTTILLEAARFEPLIVRKTARALAIKSDSSYRFERGIDHTLPPKASLRAAKLICDLAGGEVAGKLIEAGKAAAGPKTLSLRFSKLNQVLGIDIPPDEVMAAFSRLQFAATAHADHVEVTVPSWRLDINIEVDLVEEVARIIGYARIPMRDEISIRLQPVDPSLRTIRTIRDTLVAAGFYEAVTFSFVSDLLAKDFQPAEAAGLPRADAAVRKADAHLRPSILPGLLEAVARNDNNGNPDSKLFEIGSTFWLNREGKIEERRRVGCIGTSDLRAVRGAVEVILSRLDANLSVNIIPDQRAGFAAGTSGRIEWGGQQLGWIGIVDGGVSAKLSIAQSPAAAELDLPILIARTQPVAQLKPLPKFPPVSRDLSLVVKDNVRYERLETLIHNQKLAYLEEVEYLTTYRGKPLEKGTKSLTVKLVFRAPDRTLTGDEVEVDVRQIIDAAVGELGASLRA